MADIKNKIVTCFDYGNDTALAERLAREFGTVNYFRQWKDSLPETLKLVAGDGLNGVKRIRNFFDPEIINQTDVFVFADIYDGDLQVHLERMGKLVFGSRMAEGFEYKRELFAKTLKELQMEVSPYTVCVGVTALEKELQAHEDLWVKVNLRGDGETWHHENYSLSRRKLEALRYQYGAVAEMVRFTVCESIDSVIEAAYDGMMITSPSGTPQFPDIGFLGYEVKNLCHILHAIPYSSFPKAVLEVNEKFAPKLAEHNYRGFWGTEIKITEDGKNYFLDATCRASHPPTEIIQEMVANLGEFIYEGAQGNCIPLKIVKPFGVQVMLNSSWAKSNWQTVEVPEEIRHCVKLYNYCFADGAYQVIPKSVSSLTSDGSDIIGSIVALGDTIEEAIDEVKEYCNQVHGFDTENQIDALAECLRRIQEGEKEGIDFKAKIPDPATIIDS